MIAVRRVNDWLVRYPLSFAVIVVACASMTLAVVSLTQSARLDKNTTSVNRIQQRDCFVDTFQVAQAEAVIAAFSQDVPRIKAALPLYEQAKLDLQRFTAGDHVTCRPSAP